MDDQATPIISPPYPSQGTNGATAAPLRQLSVLDTPFASWGIARVRVTKNGKTHILEIPIKSVEFERVEALVAQDRPRTPKRRENIPGQGWKYVIDDTNDDYLVAIANYNRKLSYVAVLMAFDVDVCDAKGDVVWSADNTVCQYEAARNALKQMGLVENQFLSILEDVRKLTREDEETLEQD
jgi:hypothetical protein